MVQTNHSFPSARRDCFPLADLAFHTSRLKKGIIRPISNLGEVETPELLEVLAVNAAAPFVLNSRLRDLMVRTAAGEVGMCNRL